jgi:type IV pilus biogenesis protein CpaD/CtpE
MRLIPFLLLLAHLPLLVACTPNDPTLGGSLRHNYALQVIDPDPHHQGNEMEGGDGARSAAAVQRYRTDTVKQPRSISTTGRSSGGGSGSSTGSGGQ